MIKLPKRYARAKRKVLRKKQLEREYAELCHQNMLKAAAIISDTILTTIGSPSPLRKLFK